MCWRKVYLCRCVKSLTVNLYPLPFTHTYTVSMKLRSALEKSSRPMNIVTTRQPVQ